MKNTIPSIIVCLAMAIPTAAFAVEGTLGATSAGTASISVSSEAEPISEIQITGLQDIDFGTLARQEVSDRIYLNSICVYMSNASTYALEISGFETSLYNTGLGYFTSVDADAPLLTFGYAYDSAGPNGSQIRTQTPLGFLRASATPTCSPDDMASFSVATGAIYNDISNFSYVYTATITLTVTPE